MIKDTLRNKGIAYLLKQGTKRLLGYYYFKIFRLNKKFKFQGKHYNYFCRIYNATWKNERAVEIPIIKKILDEYEKKEILEVGNVLSHYFSISHDVLDKYEKTKGIINKDIVNFKTKTKYDLIISISTLEHVGFDEKIKDKNKIIKAIKNMKSMLNKNGLIIFTAPFGYNPHLDNIIEKNKAKLTEMYFLKKISKDNDWKQAKYKDVKNVKYNYPFFNANGLVVGIIKNDIHIDFREAIKVYIKPK